MKIGDTYGIIEYRGKRCRKWHPSFPVECYAYTEVDENGKDIVMLAPFPMTKTFYTPMEIEKEV